MKNILLFTVLTVGLFAKLNTIVSIPPQKHFLERIGGDKVVVTTMVTEGHSPHTYEPKPSQMKDIAKADIYFSIGVEFEKVWLNRFKNANANMKVIDLSSGIDKILISGHSHGEDHGSNHEEGPDPHIWLAPSNVKIIAKNIYDSLVKYDSKNKEYYKNNYEDFLKEITHVDEQVNDILLAVDDKAKFVVFHPSWGYFAKEYRLTQIAIEQDGKRPKPKQLMSIIKQIQSNYIEVIITSPEFSDTAAKQIAKQTGVQTVAISPLSLNWSETILNLAQAIANK